MAATTDRGMTYVLSTPVLISLIELIQRTFAFFSLNQFKSQLPINLLAQIEHNSRGVLGFWGFGV